MRLWLVVIMMMIGTATLAQNKAVADSAEQQLPALKGVDRARALYELVYYYLRADNTKAANYLKESQTLAASTTDPATLSFAYMAMGIYYNRNGNLDTAVTLLEQAKSFATKSNSDYSLVRIYAALAHTFISTGKAEKGLEYLYQALDVLESHPDIEMEMRLRTNISWAYLELKQYRNCIDFGLETLRLMENTPYEWIALYNYNNIAVSYGGIEKLDSAKYYISKGIAAAEKSADNQSLANGYFILGTIYMNAGQYQNAIEQFLKARPYREKVGNPFFLVSDLYTISDLYQKSGDYRKGLQAGLEALQLAEKYKLSLKLENTYQALAKNYEGLKDYRNASTYYRLYAIAKDSIYNNASTQAIAEMQTKYETEKKEKQLALQKAELLEQRARIQQTYVAIAGLLAALIVVVSIFLLFRARQKRKQEVFQKQQEVHLREAQIHASIESQEIERKRFAQDLHDGMGQLISALRLALHNVNKESSMEDRVSVVTRGENILNEMHHEIRSIAFNLMPQTLVQHGLIPALKEMSDRINVSGQISVRVSSLDLPERLTEIQEISLYRIIQEWVNNVVKYAEAGQVTLQLIGYENEITITLEDDGMGFDAAVLKSGSGNGWKNITARLNLIKGSIDIDTRVGMRGTTVVIRAPLTVKAPAEIAQETGSEVVARVGSATVGPNTH